MGERPLRTSTVHDQVHYMRNPGWWMMMLISSSWCKHPSLPCCVKIGSCLMLPGLTEAHTRTVLQKSRFSSWYSLRQSNVLTHVHCMNQIHWIQNRGISQKVRVQITESPEDWLGGRKRALENSKVCCKLLQYWTKTGERTLSLSWRMPSSFKLSDI
jgi:hypothetical protein